MTNIYGRIKTFPSEPIFIPARTSNGSNCTDVIDIVTNLHTNGNDQIYGIIDWDLTNISTERIIVLGNNERYAIENYLLDPLLMGILMIRENKISISDFDTLSVVTYPEFKDLTMSDAQTMIDKILTDLGLYSENKVEYITFNDWALKITKEFTEHQGHDLESLYKIKFPFLNIYQRENELKKNVIEKVINDFPNYAPKTLSETIMKII